MERPYYTRIATQDPENPWRYFWTEGQYQRYRENRASLREFGESLGIDSEDDVEARILADYDNRKVFTKFGIQPSDWRYHVLAYARGDEAAHYDGGVLAFCHELYGPTPEPREEEPEIPQSPTPEVEDIAPILESRTSDTVTEKERIAIQAYIEGHRAVPADVARFMLRLLRQQVGHGATVLELENGGEFACPDFNMHFVTDDRARLRALRILHPESDIGYGTIESAMPYEGRHYDGLVGWGSDHPGDLAGLIRPGGAIVALADPNEWSECAQASDFLRLCAAYRLPDDLMGMVVIVLRKEPGDEADYEGYWRRNPGNILGRPMPAQGDLGPYEKIVGSAKDLEAVNTGDSPKPPILPERWSYGEVRDAGPWLTDLVDVDPVEDVRGEEPDTDDPVELAELRIRREIESLESRMRERMSAAEAARMAMATLEHARREIPSLEKRIADSTETLRRWATMPVSHSWERAWRERMIRREREKRANMRGQLEELLEQSSMAEGHRDDDNESLEHEVAELRERMETLRDARDDYIRDASIEIAERRRREFMDLMREHLSGIP